MRLIGVLTHNQACQESSPARRPAVPLHHHVYEIAMHQLASGSSFRSIQSSNRELIKSKFYHGMNDTPLDKNVRYIILDHDSSRLRRRTAKRIADGSLVKGIPLVGNEWGEKVSGSRLVEGSSVLEECRTEDEPIGDLVVGSECIDKPKCDLGVKSEMKVEVKWEDGCKFEEKEVNSLL